MFSIYRFTKDEIQQLVTLLKLPRTMTTANCSWSNLEGLCILLSRLCFPKRYVDMVRDFGRSKSQLSVIFNEMVYFINNKWSFLLNSFDQPWLQEQKLREFANTIHDKGCPFTNCIGFIDGKIVPNCKPIREQRELYNGKDRIHGLKYQSIVTPNGLIAHLYGPVEGSKHDSTLLRQSNILDTISNFTAADGTPLMIYGDKAYPISPNLITPFRGMGITPQEAHFNQCMNHLRVSVEWGFGYVNKYFAFVNYPPNLKVLLQPIALYYRVAVLFANILTCVRGRNQISLYFDHAPPIVADYLKE